MWQRYRERLGQVRSALAPTQQEQREAQTNVEAAAATSVEYLFFIILSAVVATLGLITNSAPVIIGAMVIAPLMNPVMGISMGVVRGDLPLLARGLRTLGLGLVVGLSVAMLSAWVLPSIELTTEMLGRIRPTIYDLFIGMGAGAAGALAQARRSVAGALPGVAIAVSLMPPLCVTGIGLALGQLPVFYGSMLLWTANLAAINLAAIAIFLMLGFHGRRDGEGLHQFRRQVAVSIVLVLLVTMPLVHFLVDTIQQTRNEKQIRAILTEHARSLDSDAELVALEWGPHLTREDWTRVTATIRTPKLPERGQAFSLRAALESALARPVDLNLKVNPVYEYKENPEESQIYERPRPVRP